MIIFKLLLLSMIKLIIAFNNDLIDNEIDTKYVNSGQSVLLVCDLPNSMPDGQVIFLKSDNKIISFGTEIIGVGEQQRFQIDQQYAWEWSLRINSINEDDSGLYYCKIGETIIRKFHIIVQIPPRIRDDSFNDLNRLYNEGDTIKLACFATGIPYPNITWYSFDSINNQLNDLNVNSNYLVIKNVTRETPTQYQCRASNGIPPNDKRNLSFKLQFAPEIEIQSKLDQSNKQMQLNCTIYAYPLKNKHFWRKDGNYLNENLKYRIDNLIINDYKLISMLKINLYDEKFDSGLYECSAENDLRVSKIVYNLRDANLNPSNRISILKSNKIPITSIKNIEKSLDYDSYDYDLSLKTSSTPIIITKILPTRRHFRKRPSTSTRFSSFNRLIAQDFANNKPESISLKVNQDDYNDDDNDSIDIISLNRNSINKKYSRNTTTRFVDKNMPILDLYRHFNEQNVNNEFNAYINSASITSLKNSYQNIFITILISSLSSSILTLSFSFTFK